ncbi:MAG TPA: 2,3-bisphosphoglycerate-independent phosphoglycerate mutase [Gemmatimonadaceae bacterium]|nr:2,3-bisphosphoglycerate-independent phosphoglycerate mutase [Gemmatimonadaceae bacterium]
MPNEERRPVVLVVLDGWGHRTEREGNAIALANVPTWERIWARAPRTLLHASGEAVGLPAGQMGNSEVGHLNLGAGRVVMQDLVRIDNAILDRSFFDNHALVNACDHVRQRGGTLHLMGLLGDGGVHALDRHLFALLALASRRQVPHVAVHGLLDGRDTLPRSGMNFLSETLAEIEKHGATLASLGGRYYGMDRDQRWDRTKKWYDAAVMGRGPHADDAGAALQAAYDRGESDEFVQPVTITRDGTPVAPMRNGDAVICFNFRSDRMRQIVRAMAQPDFDAFDVRDRPALVLTTMTSYDRSFSFPVAFAPFSMARIVAEELADHGLTSLRTAETEKYAHVTYFFNGGIETPYRGEERMLVPSQKVATYDLMPEMSAPAVSDVLCRAIDNRSHDFVLCNFANGDMVGHSGSLPATIKACETVDACLTRVIAAAERSGVRLLITADHGNCEQMIDPATGGAHTAHTTNPVPFVLLGGDDQAALRDGGALCDVGPTILALLGVDQPSEMTGTSLLPVGVNA